MKPDSTLHGVNLSAWALAHQQVIFFMLLVMTTGVLSYIEAA